MLHRSQGRRQAQDKGNDDLHLPTFTPTIAALSTVLKSNITAFKQDSFDHTSQSYEQIRMPFRIPPHDCI